MGWPKTYPEDDQPKLLPYLAAESVECIQALSGNELLLPVIPFRVGRESRRLNPISSTYLTPKERRNSLGRPNNELYIIEVGDHRFISREHFLIHQDPDGRYYLLDRGSTLGTVVGKTLIGGNKKGGKVYLRSGDRIVPGGSNSPFVFQFHLREGKTFRLRPTPNPPGPKAPVIAAGGLPGHDR